MKENQRSMRLAFEAEPPGAVRSSQRQTAEDPLREQKLELRDLIEKEKQVRLAKQLQKGQLLDNKINQLKEDQKKLLEKRTEYKESLKRQREELEEVNRKVSTPAALQQLRQTLRELRRNLGSIQLFAQEDDIDPDDMTYEQLLELGQKIGNVSKGLSESQMKKLSTRTYAREEHGQQKCTVCYCELEHGCAATELKCRHLFHSDCIEQWLRTEKVCPLCKVETV